MAAPGPEARETPECIRLGVRPGVEPSPAPAVRIFLATEPAQHRAERVFVWSIERTRDPSRVYEVHLLKGLIGFDRRSWTTGFTNYRYAIPHYASASGRAIYNDVDQIYLGDPGELFDLPMGDHGYLALTPGDTAVMLIDCARMAEVWPLEDAQREAKATLFQRAADVPGLYGPLPAHWHARDYEFQPGRSRVLHYTNLHTQPWQPFPEKFVYQHNVHEDVWFELERSADEAGFETFSRERPSSRFPGSDAPLHRVPEEDLPWLLDERLGQAEGALQLQIECDPPGGTPRGPDGRHEQPHTADWWVERLDRAGRRRQGVRWEAELRTAGRASRYRVGGPPPDGSPPSLWVLLDDRPGNTTQSLGLAEALGWPYQEKRLRTGPFSRLHNRLLGASRLGLAAGSDPLEPPWPDLVIAAGRRTAPVALWIREQSGGRTRLVQLGRKGADWARLFDLALTPAYTRLFPHPRRLELQAPLHRITPARLSEAREKWCEQLERLPAPRLALLAGGLSGQYRMDATAAAKLGEEVVRLAREAGGSVLASASRRTGQAACVALAGALAPVPHWLYRPGDPGENPYLGFLACADSFVVTADSESILAESTSLGKPVSIYPLPERPSFRLLRSLREAVLRRAAAQPPGPRGTGRPQQGLERFCARLIERGFVRPARDLSLLHEDLVARGVATPFGKPLAPPSGKPLAEMERVVARVRQMLGVA